MKVIKRMERAKKKKKFTNLGTSRKIFYAVKK